ncbi:MAG: type IV secretory system conjugative DNA transfer family protein [Propionibacteriaceae bacterium]|nr:type IV secretory system conjugative DNA transfer family protein [Propionibacteriaceae bacterium]
MVPDIIEHDGPVISVSVKPDVLALTWRARAAKGRVWVFDPTDQIAASPGLASSVRRVRWSPLLGVDCYAAAARAAADLCKSAKTSGQQMAGRDFWDAMGRMVVGPVLFAAAVTGTAITEAAQWVLDPAAEAEVEDILVRALDQPGARPWDRAALTDWRGFKGSEERNKSSVRLTAKPILEAWGRAEIAASVDVRAKDPDRPVLDVEQLLDGGSDSLFVVAPAADQEAFRPVFETLLNALLRRIEAKAQQGMGRPLDPPLLLSLDEAGNIAAIQDLGRVVSKAAAEGVIVETVWQDLAQMVALYGPALATVVQSNHWCQMFLPGINDQSTLRAVSAMVGQDARWSEQRSWSRSSGRSGSVAERLEDVAPPDYIRATPRGQAIVVSGEHPAMRVALPAWWEDPGLRKRIAPDAAALFDGLYGAPKKTRKTRRGRGRP